MLNFNCVSLLAILRNDVFKVMRISFTDNLHVTHLFVTQMAFIWHPTKY